MFIALFVVSVQSGVVNPKPTVVESFCSLNPTHSRCLDDDKRYHPDLPDIPSIEPRRTVENSQIFWTKKAEEVVKKHSERTLNKNRAKNVIFFIGDGMGVQTITATRMVLGDENKELSFEKFPYTGSVKTYCIDAQVADSACTATAYLTGVKGNYGTIGITGKKERYACQEDEATFTHSIAKWAQDAGKDTGFVTNTRITHASPAGLYANTANRDWENDACIKYKDCDDGDDVADNLTGCQAENIRDIAHQLVYNDVSSKFKVCPRNYYP